MKTNESKKHSLRWGRMLLSACTVTALLAAMLAGCTPAAPVETASEPEVSSAVESEVSSAPEVSSAVESEVPSEPEVSSAAESEASSAPVASSKPAVSSAPAPVASSKPAAVSSAPVVVSSDPVVVSSAPAPVSSAAASSEALSAAEQTGKRRVPMYLVVEDTLTNFTIAVNVNEDTGTVYDASDFKADPNRPGYMQLRVNVQTKTMVTVSVDGAGIDEAIAAERSGRDYVYSDIYKMIEDVAVGSSAVSFNISGEDPVDIIQLTIA